jgi:hypothetical protein
MPQAFRWLTPFFWHIDWEIFINNPSMAKYGKKTQEHVEDTMHRKKKGTLKSGSGKTVKSRKQAIAIALSESREKGYKVPGKKKSAKKSGAKKSSAKKSAKKTSSRKRSPAKKSAAKKSGTTRKRTSRSKAAKKKSTTRKKSARKK